MLENLALSRIVVHEVLIAATLANKAPKHSTTTVHLDTDGTDLVCDRLINSIGHDSHSEEMLVISHETGSSFQIVGGLLDATDADFVTGAASLADKLSAAQSSGSVREGLGVFIQGTGEDKDRRTLRWLAIIKADPDRGFVKEAAADRINLKFVSDLVMGAQQRMLKVGFFVELSDPPQAGERDPADFSVRIYDHLLSNSGKGTSAVYFYSTFLGLKPADNSAKQCRDFYEKTKEFTDELSTSPEEKVKFRGQLIAYLRSEREQISVRDFSDNYIPQNHRRAYLRKMGGTTVPDHAIRRDTSLIKKHLKTQSMRFSSKIVIVGPEDTLQSQVRFGDVVEIDGSDWTELKIKGKLE